jgi:hypothetical protein
MISLALSREIRSGNIGTGEAQNGNWSQAVNGAVATPSASRDITHTSIDVSAAVSWRHIAATGH